MGGWNRGAALVLAFLLLAPASLATTETEIQPGDAVVEGDAVSCTLGFAFEGEGLDHGRAFFGIAAHCVDGVGDRVHVRDVGPIGTVIYHGDPSTVRSDVAIVEVDEDLRDNVNPAVRGHPNVPIGIARDATTATGDPVGLYGWGKAFRESSLTRSERSGVLVDHDAERVRVEAPISFGDSGGPWFLQDGRALAMATGLQASVSCCPMQDVSAHAHGPTIENVLARAQATGLTIDLDTV